MEGRPMPDFNLGSSWYPGFTTTQLLMIVGAIVIFGVIFKKLLKYAISAAVVIVVMYLVIPMCYSMFSQ